jgi:hypothetical protein
VGLLRRLRSTLRVAFGRRGFEAGMADELRFHLDARVDDLVRAGASTRDAERQARLELGGLESLKDTCARLAASA